MAEPKYQGYTGKNSSYKTFLKNVSGAAKNKATEYAKQSALDEEKRLADEAEKRQKALNEAKGLKSDGTEKGLLEKAGDLGKGLIGGLQQTGAKVADVAVKGGAVLENMFEQDNEKVLANLKRSEKLRNLIKSGKDVTGQSFAGTKDISAQEVMSDPRKAAELAGESLDVATGATMFLNPASVVKNAAGEVVKATGKQTAKQIAKEAATFGAVDALGGGAKTYGETGDVGKAVVEGAKTGLTSALTQGVLGGAATVAGKVLSKGKKVTPTTEVKPTENTGTLEAQKQLPATTLNPADIEKQLNEHVSGNYTPDMYDVTTQSGKSFTAEDIANATQKQTDELSKQVDVLNSKLAAQDPNTPMYADTTKQINDLEAQIKDINASGITPTGEPIVSTTLNADKVRTKFTELQDQLKLAKEQQATNERFAQEQAYNETGRAPADIQSELDAIDSGVQPEALKQPMDKPKSALEVITRPDISPDIKKAADEIATDKAYAQAELDKYMTTAKATAEKASIDNDLVAFKESIKDLPPERQKYELDNYMQGYSEKLADVDNRLANDVELADAAQQVLDKINTNEQEFLTRVNMFDNATGKTKVDETKLTEYRNSLVKELEDAKRFTETNQILSENADNLETAIDTNPKVNDAYVAKLAEDTQTYAPKDISGLRRTFLSIASHSNNFEAFGIRDIYRNIAKAKQSAVNATKNSAKVLAELGKDIKDGKLTNQQLIDALEGRAKISELPESATAVKALLDDAAVWIQQKTYKDTLSDLVKKNETLKDGKKLSLEDMQAQARAKAEKSTMKNYFTHMDLDADGKAVVRSVNQGKGSADVNFGSLMQRTAKDAPYSDDTVKVLSAYFQGLHNKQFMEPAFKPLNDPEFQKALNDTEKAYFADYIGQVKNLKVSALEEGFNNLVNTATKGKFGGNEYRRILGAQRMLSAVAGMGGNVSSIIRQLTQSNNTVAATGVVNATRGMKHFMDAVIEAKRTGNMPDDLKKLVDSGVMDQSSMASIGDEMARTINGSSGIKEIPRKATDILMSGIKYSDMMLRGQAYYAGLLDGAKKGLTGEKLTNHAIDLTNDTQFITSRLDMPKAFNGPLVRSLSQFATFSAKQAEFLGKYGIKAVTNPKTGKLQIQPQEMARLLQAGVVGYGMTALLAPTIGFQPTEWVPFLQNIAEGSAFRSPMVRLLAGDPDKGKVGLNSLIWNEDIYDEVTGEKRKMTPDEAAKRFLEDNWSGIIPGGAQIKKTLGGAEMIQQGSSKNAKGNTQFVYNKDTSPMVPSPDIQALLFGKYANKEGQKWVSEGMSTLSKKQTEVLDSTSDAKKQQFYDFYVSAKKATGRSNALDKVKELALTRPTAAEDEAIKYNRKVDEALSDYWKRNTGMPQELKDTMMKDLYINFNKVNTNIVKDASKVTQSELDAMKQQAKYETDRQ